MSTTDKGPPSGFFVALPEGWVSLDVNPSTSAESVRRIVGEAARANQTIAQHRVAFEQLLTQVATEARASNVQFCGCWFQLVNGTLPVQASLTVGFHGVTVGNSARSMYEELTVDSSNRSVELVELEAGPSVCRTGRRREALAGMDEPIEYLGSQYYVPVPGTTDQVALLSFASPTLVLEEELRTLFRAMAHGFSFTWLSRSRSD